jgi:urease accessory protein
VNEAGDAGLTQGMERARGAVRLSASLGEGRVRVADLAQSGCGRLLFPAVAETAALEAVVVNTSGGLTGGDRFEIAARVEAGASLVLTTQACEKIYRSSGGDAVVATRLTLAAGTQLSWVPQETILFERSELSRTLHVEMAETAKLVVVEAVLLGRRASGETIREIRFRDSWRVRRGGRLVFAEEMRLGEDLTAALAGRATLAGAAGFATVLVVAKDAETRLADLRRLTIDEAVECGFSSFDGLCLGRLVAQDGASLRTGLVCVLQALGGAVPRVWSI